MPEFPPIIQKVIRGAQYLLGRYRDDRCSEIAAALVYMSLFALVPLLTVLYAIASAIPTVSGIEAQLQDYLLGYLVPDSSQDVITYLQSFSEQAKNLTGFGIAILTVTAILMLRNVERAFNNVWRNKENRGAISSLLLYWAVLSLAPVIMGLGIGIQAYLYAAASAIADIDVLGISTAALSLLPMALSILGLTGLYMAVPNSQVPFRHALAGGAFAAIAFAIARLLFTSVMSNSSYTFVYGAFAAVPLFLLWLYVTWNIVLIGAIVVHSLSAYQTEAQANRPLLLKALDVLYLLWRAQRKGQAMSELKLLRSKAVVPGGLDSESWRTIRDAFKEARLLEQNSQGHYLLSRDLHAVDLNDIKRLINEELDIPDVPESALTWQKHASELIRNQRNDQRERLAIKLHDLFTEANH
jgi:membrane protein